MELFRHCDLGHGSVMAATTTGAGVDITAQSYGHAGTMLVHLPHREALLLAHALLGHLVPDGPPPLSTGEVGRLFGLNRDTIAQWAKAGRLPSFRTPGGHLRFRREDVAKAMERTGK